MTPRSGCDLTWVCHLSRAGHVPIHTPPLEVVGLEPTGVVSLKSRDCVTQFFLEGMKNEIRAVGNPGKNGLIR